MMPISLAIVTEGMIKQLPQDYTFFLTFGLGVIALIISAYNFQVTRARNSQSEQIKTSRDIWAGIIGRYKELEKKTKAAASDPNRDRESLIQDNIWPLLGEIDYFAYLILTGGIQDKVVLGYYKGLLKEEIRYVFSHYGTDRDRYDWRTEYHNLNQIIAEWNIDIPD